MLIAISTYTKPLAEVDAHRSAHLQFLKPLFDSGKVIISGRRHPPQGGVIISNSLTLQEFKDLLSQDPFTQAGVAHYEIIEFTPTFCAPGIVENKSENHLC